MCCEDKDIDVALFRSHGSTRSNRSMSANVWLLLNEGQIKLIFRVPLDGSHLAGFAHLT